MEQMGIPARPFLGHGGITLPHLKGTSEFQTEILPTPASVIISMQQHVGEQCTPVVKPGDKVSVGQLIGDSDAFVSAPVHASVSGTVTEFTRILLPNGQWADAVKIEADGEQTLWSGIKPPVVRNAAELCKALRASGLVGLGGAGFPAHVKLAVPEGKAVDTLVINGAECEPYLTSDYREMVEAAGDVVNGIHRICDILGIKKVVIGVESNKPRAIQLLTDIARSTGGGIKVMRLHSQYPQGAEKVLVHACTGRRIPKGKLPADVGCVVLNITSIAFISRYLRDGVPLISKRLTVDGSAILDPKNVLVPIGTQFSEIIRFCGGYKTEPRKLLVGGPMMGFAMYTEDTPTLKQNNGLIALSVKGAGEKPPTECIRCGRCVRVCPMKLMPLSIENKVKAGDTGALERLSVRTCMECGCCAFSCPARRQLVQYMRMGKTLLRKKDGLKK